MNLLPASLRQFNRQSLGVLHERIHSAALMHDVKAIVSTDRWNSFDQFHRTTRHLVDRYRSAGAHVEVHPIPTGGPDGSGRWRVQEASDVLRATVDVIQPVRRRVLDFAENPWHVVQWSAATPREGTRSTLMILDDLETLRRVPAGALRGKMILTHIPPWHRAHEFLRTGADGILVDNRIGTGFGSPPRPGSTERATEWTKLGWCGLPLEHAAKRLVALAMSVHDGRALRALVAKGRPVMVHTRVDIRRYVGTHDLVSGVVRGAGDPQDEMWALAHSAEPGAADNASGVAACIAAAGAMEQAIRDGKLPRPKRSIRFLNGYECYSFFHYLEHVKRLQPPLAGICVDTIGHKPVSSDGQLNWHSTLPSSATFVNEVGEGILRGALRLDNPGYHVVAQPFVSTEDTLVGDPKYGFPCPWINTHYRPGRVAFAEYHTSADTLALLSPRGLRVCTTAVAGYLYYLADAGTRELLEMAQTHTKHALIDLARERSRQSRAWAEFREVQHTTSMQRLQRWTWGGERRDLLTQLRAQSDVIHEAVTRFRRPSRRVARLPKAATHVPFRTALLAPDYENLQPDVRKRLESSGLSRQPLFWADGCRSLAEIAALHAAEMERPVDVAKVIEYFEGMQAARYVDLVPRAELVTQAQIERGLRAVGVKPGMVVMVHSSLSRIGHVAGGADTVIDAMLAVIGRKGTLVLPTFNHGLARVYNPQTTPTANGAIPDAGWRRPGAIRSEHGTHPVAAIGPRAAELCAGHVEAGIWDATSPIGRLVHSGGYVLCLGVAPETATAYHIAEISKGAPCLSQFEGKDTVVTADGRTRDVPGLLWRGANCPVLLSKLESGLERRDELNRGPVGQTTALLFRAADLWRLRRQQLGNTCRTCKVRPDPKWKNPL